MNNPVTSLIISTYNWPEALEMCLLSILAQSKAPDEVIIADDGSSDSTLRVIQEYKTILSTPVIHVWHPDEGFRLATIRNKAIAVARGDYIIQIDGDLILHRDFVADHLRFAASKTFVRASRTYLDSNLSKKILDKKNIYISLINRGVSNRFSALRFPALWSLFETRYKSKGNELYEIHGCNMAYWRRDAITVNGYNEKFAGWGPEDKEFVVRLLNSGLRRRFLKLGAIAYHLYHPENNKANLDKNQFLFREAIDMKLAFCEKGISQYQ